MATKAIAITSEQLEEEILETLREFRERGEDKVGSMRLSLDMSKSHGVVCYDLELSQALSNLKARDMVHVDKGPDLIEFISLP